MRNITVHQINRTAVKPMNCKRSPAPQLVPRWGAGERFRQNNKPQLVALVFFSLLLVLLVATGRAAEQAAPEAAKAAGATQQTHAVTIPTDVGAGISQQAGQVKKQLEARARSLFHREPLEFDWDTAQYIYQQIIGLPLQIPILMQALVEQSRLLGFVGSILILTFLIALVYSLLGQKRLMQSIETKLSPFTHRLPESVYPSLLATIRVVIAALFPLLLLAAFNLVSDLTAYEAPWFRLIGKLLLLWVAGSLIINLLRELLTQELFTIDPRQGTSLFKPARLVVLYSVVIIGLFWAAAAFHLRQDVLALFQFAISLSIIVILFLLLLKKRALLSMLPNLPHPGYRKFQRFFAKYYFPLIILTLLLAVLWVLGYHKFGQVVLVKIWSSFGGYLAIMVLYHLLLSTLQRWYGKADREDETAALVYRSFKQLLLYATVLATVLVVLNLLGLLGLLKQVMSFTVFSLGATGVTLWILLEAILILLAFIFFSRLLEAYLDYKVYPAMGVETGLGYAINTFLKYLLLAIGVLIALNVVGLDLRLLMVFTGAVGIGIGIGLQNMAANVISGFTLIFGGLLRKGDWIAVGDAMGRVTDIHLRATKVRTRDNIEYLIPNTKFISDTMVNYTLGSPLIRIRVPVGVSYAASPEQVKEILLNVASNESLVSKTKPPQVYFVEFGDSSINFELLVWIDVRTTALNRIHSALYFAIFAALAEAGIEIPFPQRDLHIRSTVATSRSTVDTAP